MRKDAFLVSTIVLVLVASAIVIPNSQARHIPPAAQRLASQCWLMDEMTGTVTKDSCGSNDGTKHANVVIQSSGIFGFSYAFDNTQTTTPVSVPHFTTPNQFTLESWFFPLSLPTTGDPNRVMFKAQYYNLQMGGSGLCRFEVFIGAAYSALACSTLPTLNVWNHVVGTYDGTMMKIYMNGVLVNSKSQTGSVGDGTSTTLTIGGGPGAPFTVTNFHGRIDVTRKFGYALTAEEVREYYYQHDWEKASQEQVWMAQSTSSTGAVGATTVFVPEERDKEPLVSGFSTWEISGTFSAPAQPGTSTQTFQFQVDGTNVAGCTWTLIRGAVAVGLIVVSESNYLARCPNPFYVEPGSHTLSVVIGGTTVVTASRTDFMLLQETSHMGYDSYYGPINYDLEIARSSQTNGYVNSTSAAIIATVDFNQLQTEVQLNEIHTHIDSHFAQTWGMLTSFEGNITAILNDLCSGGGCNFTVETEPVIQALEAQQMRFLDLDTQTSWTFLLFLALLIWCWYQRWLFVAIASVIGILDAFMVPHVLGFKGTALVLVAGVVLQILVDMRDAWREKKEQEEASGGETT